MTISLVSTVPSVGLQGRLGALGIIVLVQQPHHPVRRLGDHGPLVSCDAVGAHPQILVQAQSCLQVAVQLLDNPDA